MSAPANPKGPESDRANAILTSPFVASLRARPETIRIGGAAGAAGSWMVRAQMPEVWDAVRFEIPPTASVLTLKQHALAQLTPDADDPTDFVTKLHGAEILDEEMSLADVGARNGSTFLFSYRRRRPVR